MSSIIDQTAYYYRPPRCRLYMIRLVPIIFGSGRDMYDVQLLLGMLTSYIEIYGRLLGFI